MSLAMEVRERPILFSGAMVRAILDGRKTQTRRVVKPQPTHRLVEPKLGLTIGMDPADDGAVWYDADGISPGRPVRCPYGRPLDRLWVREAWHCPKQLGGSFHREKLHHREDFEYRGHRSAPGFDIRWKPSIHMPRWASRITLEIADVRVERVQAISDRDCEAEGVRPSVDGDARDWRSDETGWRRTFRQLWDQINGPRGYGWDANPWVWVIGFRKVGV